VFTIQDPTPFLSDKGNGCQTPSQELGIQKPRTSSELEAALEEIKPDKKFTVRVIDVSEPQG
jgi:hypothetical protein